MPDPMSFPVWPRPVRQFMRSLGIAAEGMATQQKFMEVIASNIANAETTRTPEGGPYRRQVASVGGDPLTGVGGIEVGTDAQPGRRIYDPGHPDADADGFVLYPNVDINTELVDLMVVRRVHEANASVFQAAKSMLKRALEI